MEHQGPSHCPDTAVPPKSRTRLPPNSPSLPSRTELKSEWDDKAQCAPAPGPSTSSTHVPSKRAPSDDLNPGWASNPHAWPSYATLPNDLPISNPRFPYIPPDDRYYSAALAPSIQTLQQAGTTRPKIHTLEQEAQYHRSKRARTATSHHHLSNIIPQTHSHTFHPSEWPLPRNGPDYSKVWATRGPDANARPLPTTTKRNERFDHRGNPHGPSRLSTVTSIEDQGHESREVKVKSESNNPDYQPTIPHGPRGPRKYDNPQIEQERNPRNRQAPIDRLRFYPPAQHFANRRMNEPPGSFRQLSNGPYRSIEGGYYGHYTPPQVASGRLWHGMYKGDIGNIQLNGDLRRLSEGADDLTKNSPLLRRGSASKKR